MHELSIATSLQEQILQALASEHVHRLNTITVSVGKLSGVDPDALQAAFQIVAERTITEKATLRMEEVPCTVQCRQCSHHFEAEPPFPVCSQCGSLDVQIKDGMDLILKSLEFE